MDDPNLPKCALVNGLIVYVLCSPPPSSSDPLPFGREAEAGGQRGVVASGAVVVDGCRCARPSDLVWSFGVRVSCLVISLLISSNHLQHVPHVYGLFIPLSREYLPFIQDLFWSSDYLEHISYSGSFPVLSHHYGVSARSSRSIFLVVYLDHVSHRVPDDLGWLFEVYVSCWKVLSFEACPTWTWSFLICPCCLKYVLVLTVLSNCSHYCMRHLLSIPSWVITRSSNKVSQTQRFFFYILSP